MIEKKCVHGCMVEQSCVKCTEMDKMQLTIDQLKAENEELISLHTTVQWKNEKARADMLLKKLEHATDRIAEFKALIAHYKNPNHTAEFEQIVRDNEVKEKENARLREAIREFKYEMRHAWPTWQKQPFVKALFDLSEEDG